MRIRIYLIVPLLLFLLHALLYSCNKEVTNKKMNVVFIAVDDLRPEINYYGSEYMHTPQMDKLASESRVFLNHFVFCAACGPSRSTLLSGKRTLDWDVFRPIRESGNKPDSIFSLPQLFKENGYKTVGIGKISHKPGGVMDSLQTIPEVPYSWDLTYAPVGEWKNPWNAFFSYSNGKYRSYGYQRRNDISMPPIEAKDVEDEGYADGLNAREAVEQLRSLKDTSFFLAVGFYKPHLPFNAPKKYWDLYNPDELPEAVIKTSPAGLESKISLHSDRESYEPRTHYTWTGESSNYPITEERAKILKHGYCAAVSYVDAQIGKVLNEIKALGLEEETIVVLWGDHGWHLGDYGLWGKNTNYDVALRSPLIIKVPGMNNPGDLSSSLVETVDIFPTLTDLCGLPRPRYLEGKSMSDIINDPNASIKAHSISARNAFGAEGYTIRDRNHRLMAWKRKDSINEIELFDYSNNTFVNTNIADNKPSKLDALLQKLQEITSF